jgi:hypothetical protein
MSHHTWQWPLFTVILGVLGGRAPPPGTFFMITELTSQVMITETGNRMITE